MKQEALLILDPEYLGYYGLKKNFIDANFSILKYLSFFNEWHGKTLDNIEVLPLSDAKKFSDKKIIVAVPLNPALKEYLKLLLTAGYKRENIILLLDKPEYSGNENICQMRKDISFRVAFDGEVICQVGANEFLVDTNNELYIVKEIFAEMCYEFFFPVSNAVVIDIGMNIGIASVYFAQRENVQSVYAFEPFLPTYARALDNFKLNVTNDKILPHPYGIGGEDKDLEIKYNENLKGCMSTTRDNSAFLDPNCEKSKAKIKIVDIAKSFSAIIDKHPDAKFVFKIDCEGGEYDIFNRLDQMDMFKHIHFIVMEWHNDQVKNVRELERVLQKNGFFYRLTGNRDGEVINGNIFAVNCTSMIN